MLKNYFNVAFRNLRKNKLYSFINIAGLTLGTACCVLIALYIYDETMYDHFHQQGNRIVRATMEFSNAGTINKVATTGTKAGPQLKRTFPEIEAFVRTFKTTRVVTCQDKQFDEHGFLYADSSFFKVFSFPLTEGNVKTALNEPGKVVLSENAAKKYFGDEAPLGKTLLVGTKDYEVTGVAANAPGNSQIQFDFIASFSNLDAAKTEEWFTANYITYFLLHDESQIADLQAKVNSYMQQGVKKELGFEGSDYLTYNLEPFTRVHLHSSLEGFEPNGNITYLYILGIIALLILSIACVNYTNLAIAQFSGRTGEIGIRKVMGALRGQLFIQFIGESVLLTLIALAFAILLCALLLPVFNEITTKAFTAAILFQPLFIGFIFTLGLVVSLAAGVYPALILSNTGIVKILKSGFSMTSSGGTVKKSLVVFQFAISIFLIISTMIILQQLSYIRHKNLGYDKEHILILPVDGRMTTQYEEIKSAIGNIPGVVSISGAYEPPTFVQWGDGIDAETGVAKKQLSVNAIPADPDFISTLGMQLVAGTDFTSADLLLQDTSDNYKNYRNTFILNETAAKELGWKPEEAIGQTISKGFPGTVKGVVKDFHFASLHQPIGPLVIFVNENLARNFFVKIHSEDLSTTISQLEKMWKARVPYRPFEYHFLDEDYNSLYVADRRTAQIIGIASGLAVILACLGLFGLAAFTMAQRTKEIGIRKILGAGLKQILILVSGDFLKLVAIAVFVASPAAWVAGNKWLEDFAYRISIEWWVFAVAGVASLLIAFLTISTQAIKVAVANPVKSLRTE